MALSMDDKPTPAELKKMRPLAEIESEQPWRQEAQAKGGRGSYLAFLLSRVPNVVQAWSTESTVSEHTVQRAVEAMDLVWSACHRQDAQKMGARKWWELNYTDPQLKKARKQTQEQRAKQHSFPHPAKPAPPHAPLAAAPEAKPQPPAATPTQPPETAPAPSAKAFKRPHERRVPVVVKRGEFS